MKKSLLFLCTVFLLSLCTLWSYFYFSPDIYNRQSVLELTAGVEKKGIPIYDERNIEQELILPERADEIVLPFQLDNAQAAGSLVLSARQIDDNKPFWSQSVALNDTYWNEAHFTFLPHQLVAKQKYVVRVATQGVDAHAGLRLPYEYGDDSSYQDGNVRIYSYTAGEWKQTNDQTGNIALKFYSEPPLGTRIRLAGRKFFLPAMLLVLIGFASFRIISKTKPRVASFPAWNEIGKIFLIGLVLSVLATLPTYQDFGAKISTHGDIQRGLIFSGIARQAILAGQLPLWNSFTCGGGPMLADLESWFLQPFFFVTLPFNEILALKISYTLTLLTFFVGAVILGRVVFRFRLLPSVAFGVLLAFGGYLTQHLSEGYFVWIGAAWIPWFLLFGVLSFKNIRFIPISGLMLAFMFGGGTMHMVVYSLLYLALVALFTAKVKYMPKYFGVIMVITLFFASIAAIKLIPAATLLHTNESRQGFTPSITLLPKMLLDRGLVDPLLHNGTVYRWTEFGNYIGFLGIGLVFVGLWLFLKKDKSAPIVKSFLLASTVMLLIAFTPIPITEGPLSRVVDLFRMPSRTMIFPLIGLAVLAAYALQKLPTQKYATVGLFIVSLLTIDLVSNDNILFRPTFTLAMPNISPQNTFTRVIQGYTTQDERFYRAAYIDFREHKGTNDLCRFYQPVPSTTGSDSSNPLEPYLGEVYLDAPAKGSVTLRHVDKNMIAFDADMKEPAKVIVNQNYYPGWQVKNGAKVENVNGLIAVPLLTGQHSIEIEYRPSVVKWSLIISLLTLVIVSTWFIYMPRLFQKDNKS